MIKKIPALIYLVILFTYLVAVCSCKESDTLEKGVPPLKFHQTRPTLARITEIISKKQKGAYLRFGDGDVNLALGISDMKQPPNVSLAHEMRKAFAINGPTILKALPLHCKEFGGLEDGMFPGNHEANIDACIQMLKKVEPFWPKVEPFWPEVTDIYSPIALHFCATNHLQP